jgi:hypothetical protein
MDEKLRKEYRDYAWNYFSLHADHRLRVFNFFVVFTTILVSTFATLVAQKGLRREYALLPASLIFFSFLFLKLELRIKALVKNGEEALKYLDAACLDDIDGPLSLFHNDDRKTKELPLWPLTVGHFSYARVFIWVYRFSFLVGLVGLVVCLWGK